MALTFAELQDELGRVLSTGVRSGDSIRTSFGRWINMACKRIAYAYPWDSMRAEQRVATVAPYSTGTATFTNGSTTVAGTSTVWSSAFVGRKVALGVGQPYYRIATRVSNTEITIAEAYAEATATDTTYTAFQDEYNLAATTHAIEDAAIFDGTWSGPLHDYEQRQFDHSDFAGWSTGPPVAYCVATSTTVGTPRVRLSPVPDDVYRTSWKYLKTWTDLTGSESYATQGLPEDVEELILDRALRWAPRVEGSRQVMSESAWNNALAKVWAAYSKRRYRFGVRSGFSTSRFPTIVFNSGGL